MAKLTSNPTTGTLRGTVGELVYAHLADGQVVVRHRAGPTSPPSNLQEKSRSHFRIAVAYVRSVRQQPESYAVYKTAALIRRKRPCDLAMADCLNPPQIGNV